MSYGQSAKDIAAELGSDLENGLSIETAHGRVHSRGRNIITAPKARAGAGLWKHMLSFMNCILILMAVIHLVADGGRGWALSLCFGVCAVLNGFVGYVTFKRDSTPASAAAAAQSGSVRVVRGGVENVVPAVLLAQGDVIFLEKGQTVPADARIISSDGVVADENIFHGEGGAVAKAASGDENVTMVYMGTKLLSGSLKAIVTQVGGRTRLGSAIAMLGNGDRRISSMAAKNASLGNIFSAIAVLVWLTALLLRLARGYGVASAFDNSIAAAIAVLPVFLPPLVLAAVSFDILSLRKRGIYISSASALESLGASTVLFVGKRGTLTETAFGVGAVRAAKGLDPDKLRLMAAMCATADLSGNKPVGDPMQVALIEDALDHGVSLNQLRQSRPVRVEDRHSERRIMTTVHKTGNGYLTICKGAPDAVAARCTKIYDDGLRDIDTVKDLADILSQSAGMSADALSVMAVAYRESSVDSGEASGLVFAGLVGLSNPVRPGTAASLKRMRAMGVRTCLITNENLTTASAVARQSGISDEGYQQGENIDCDNVKQLRKASLFAEVSAEKKEQIVSALNYEKENVAVVGRGVRDIGAMNAADVSIATDAAAKVCSAAADINVTGSGIERVEEAVAKCKRSFVNIDRMIGFMLSCNIAQAFCVLVSLAMGYAATFSSWEIIWMELASMVIAAIGIWREPYDRPDMAKSELNTMKSGRLSKRILLEAILRGILVGSAAMLVYGLSEGIVDIYQRRGAVFVVLSVGFAFMALSCRSSRVFFSRIHKNPVSIVCFALNIILLVIALNTPLLSSVFWIDVPRGSLMAVCIPAGIGPMLIAEAVKLFSLKTASKKPEKRARKKSSERK